MRSGSLPYLLNSILTGPIEVLFTLLIFILGKNMGATPLQLTVIACLKPTTSLISYQISSIIHGRRHLIRPYLMVHLLIGSLPCFLFPFIDNVWFFIGSYAVFMIAKRAQEPAWIEFMKSHLQLSAMSKVISRGTSIAYFFSMFLPPLLSTWLEGDLWKALFLTFALLQLLSLASVAFLRCGDHSKEKVKKGWDLVADNPSYRSYLALFFLGGAGIVALQPILPTYFNDELEISFTELTLAFSFCKGVAFLVSSPWWARLINRISLYRLNAYMNVLTSLFIVGLLAATYGTEWLYVAYLCYGAMQAACDLSWNLSGPIFAGQGQSSPFSSLNLALVGIRGCICPFLGLLLFGYAGTLAVFMLSLGLCLLGVVYGFRLDRKTDIRYQFNNLG